MDACPLVTCQVRQRLYRCVREVRIALAVAVALLGVACTDTTGPSRVPKAASFDHTYGYVEDPRLRCWGPSEPYTYYRAEGPFVRCVQQWAIAEDIGGKAIIDKTFRGPLNIAFSEPVYRLVVESSGAYLCSGPTYGSVTATFASGRQQEIAFEKGGAPEDCGPDDTGGPLRLTVPGDEGITQSLLRRCFRERGLTSMARSPIAQVHTT